MKPEHILQQRLIDIEQKHGGLHHVDSGKKSPLDPRKKWGRMRGGDRMSFHDPYKKKYAGLNQSSMGWMMENGYDDIVTVLPEKYNCVEPWTVTDDTRLIHIKGVLRRNIFRSRPKPELESIVSIWREYAD